MSLLYLCTDAVISLYRGRFYAQYAKNSLLYREYRYIEDRFTGFCPIHLTVTFAGTYHIYRYTGDIVLSRIVVSGFHLSYLIAPCTHGHAQ